MIPEAVLHVLEKVWSALAPLNRPMAVIGGIALSNWKRLRATRDIDILMAISAADVDEVSAALADVHVKSRRRPVIQSLGDLNIVQLAYEPPDAEVRVSVDLLFGDSPFLQQALSRSVAMQLAGISATLSVVSCEDLVLLKLKAGRIIDLADAAALLRANRETVDRTYLRQWAESLKVAREYDQVRQEAWPDEA